MQPPPRQPGEGLRTGMGHRGRVGRQVPGGDLVGVQGSGTGHEEGDIVLGLCGEQGLDQVVADGLE